MAWPFQARHNADLHIGGKKRMMETVRKWGDTMKSADRSSAARAGRSEETCPPLDGPLAQQRNKTMSGELARIVRFNYDDEQIFEINMGTSSGSFLDEQLTPEQCTFGRS